MNNTRINNTLIIFNSIEIVEYFWSELLEKYIAKVLKKGFTCPQLVENPNILFNLVIKEIAIDLDKNYPNHISHSPNIYAISALTGNVVKITAKVKSFKTFGAFRSFEEASYAKEILKPVIKVLFDE